MYSRVATSLVRGSVRRARSYHHEAGHHKPPSMDDLPVPSGSWQAQYDANQTKYNLHLAIGVGTLVGSIFAAKASGLVELNASVPKLN